MNHSHFLRSTLACAATLGMAAGATWWYVYSREERFQTYETLATDQPRRLESSRSVVVGPGFVAGSF